MNQHSSWLVEIVFWISSYLILHPFLIYPYSLVLLDRLRKPKNETHKRTNSSSSSEQTKKIEGIEPRVALVVSTYNEGKRIEAKLHNVQNLDYPKDRLQVYLLSDACSDETVNIAERHSNTTLLRSATRKGKSAVLDEFVHRIDADILVFSDANSLYDTHAIRRLVAPLADPSVGYVVGRQKYFEEKHLPAAQAENLYWNRESWIKSLESKLGSVVGGDGAIYAIRKSDYVSLQPSDESDFYLPLQLEIKGLGGVYEPCATCHENASERFEGQFWRKMRIVNRSLYSTWRSPAALNPCRVGIFAYLLWSHKVLRWLTPCHLIVAAITLGMLCYHENSAYRWIAIPPAMICLAAFLYLIPGLSRFRLFYLSFYFVIMNLSALLGLVSFVLGYRVTTWQPDRQ